MRAWWCMTPTFSDQQFFRFWQTRLECRWPRTVLTVAVTPTVTSSHLFLCLSLDPFVLLSVISHIQASWSSWTLLGHIALQPLIHLPASGAISAPFLGCSGLCNNRKGFQALGSLALPNWVLGRLGLSGLVCSLPIQAFLLSCDRPAYVRPYPGYSSVRVRNTRMCLCSGVGVWYCARCLWVLGSSVV